MTPLEHAVPLGCLLALTAALAGCQTPESISTGPTTAGLLEGVAQGDTRLVDLTHPLSPSNPYWPGPGYGPFSYETFATLENDGVLSGRFAMAEHTGTHVDAPNHFVRDQVSLDRIPITQLVAPATVIDARDAVSRNPDYQLSVEDIGVWEADNGLIPPGALVLLYTGWDSRWDDFDRYKNQDESGGMHFPGFSPSGAEFLVTTRNVSGLGIDTLSVDYGASQDFAVHHISHGGGKYHLENAANLGQLPPLGAWVVVAPIKIEGGTGGPARVFAFIEN